MSKPQTWAIMWVGLLFIASSKTVLGTEYDIIAHGRLTGHGAIVGRSTRAGDGRTWAQAKEITTSAKRKHWSWYATGPGAGIQLERGKHKGRLIIPCDHKALPEGGPQTNHSQLTQ